MPLKTRCRELGRCVHVNVALPNQWALRSQGLEAAADQAAALKLRQKLPVCTLTTSCSGEAWTRPLRKKYIEGGVLCPVSSSSARVLARVLVSCRSSSDSERF